VRSSWAALATKRFCASKALSGRSSSPSTVSARFRSSSRGPRRASRSWTLRAEIRLMAVFIVRSGRNILPVTSQPSTNEMTDVRLARGRPGDGVRARRSRPSPVACGERAPPRRPRPRRSPLRQRPPGRTTRRIRRRGSSSVTRNPQVLTISVISCCWSSGAEAEAMQSSLRVRRRPESVSVAAHCNGVVRRSEHRTQGDRPGRLPRGAAQALGLCCGGVEGVERVQ
jgi:hypothetical protein